MKNEELMELEFWLAKNVMEYRPVDSNAPGPTDHTQCMLNLECLIRDPAYGVWLQFSPTKTKRDAMEVLEKCIQKRTESWDVYCPGATLVIHGPHKGWDNNWVIGSDAEMSISAKAKTLPLAICLFAKLIFS